MTAAPDARALTEGERRLARSLYHDAIDLDRVEIRKRKWWPFQSRRIVMAPCGHLHFHPHSPAYADDFGRAPLALQGLFVHELCHVWQHQRGLILPIRRHPFCRYAYGIVPGRPLARYGIEQQAEIVRHAFLARVGRQPEGKPDVGVYETLLATFHQPAIAVSRSRRAVGTRQPDASASTPRPDDA